jgi:hypothetical protein
LRGLAEHHQIPGARRRVRDEIALELYDRLVEPTTIAATIRSMTGTRSPGSCSCSRPDSP